MDSPRFIASLKQLHRDVGGPVLVVADNAKYHHSKATGRFIEEQDGQIHLVYPPPYSPDLNPDEQVRNHAKRELGTRAILSRPTLEKAVSCILRSFQRQKDRVRIFSRFPGTRYYCGYWNCRYRRWATKAVGRCKLSLPTAGVVHPRRME